MNKINSMKNIRRACGVLACSVFLSLTSCQKEDAMSPSMDTTEFATAEYQLEGLDGLENPEVTEATETRAFGVRDDGNEQDRHSLRVILRQLNLNETQRTAIKGFAEEQATCIAEHRAKVKERHEVLVNRANAVREEYVKAYRAGRITKAQLDEKLSTLREKLKGQLQSDEQKQMRMRIIRKCRVRLLTNIASVLNREQLHKFNRWRESLK